MIINHLALKRQSTVLVLLVFILLAGTFAYQTLPRESEPDITIPYVFVTTNYEGVAPEDMETLITIPLERKLKGIADVEEITSLSDDGVSSIAIEFLPSVDIDDALQKVREKVDQAMSDLPSDLPNDPEITEVNFSEFPIIQVVLSGPFSLKRLKVFAEKMEDRFESVPGVLDAEIIGGLEREIHVEFDLDRVGFYNVPFSSMLEALERGNVNQPGGSMDIGPSKYLVRVPEDFKHPQEINQIVAFVRDGRPVYLRDVATIVDSYEDPLTRSRINGQNSVTIQIKKRSGENIIEIVDQINAIIAEMEGTELPPSLIINVIGDKAHDIRNMVADLQNNILTGLLLVLVIVFAFIGGRSALFVALAIPLSMLITFSLLQAFDITLNMVVLFSLTLALGMLVDNGIVIVENIYRHMQEGKSKWQAAQDATDEVAWPVITSTLTTVGAFLPLIFWPGIMGEFMSFLPKTVILALLASLFVALVVNPVLSARYQTIKKQKPSPKGSDRNSGGAEPTGDAFDSETGAMALVKRGYMRLLTFCLNNRGLTMAFAFLLFIVSTYSFVTYGKGLEFFPDVEPARAYVYIKAPVGTNLDATDEWVHQVEEVLAEYDEIRAVIANVGSGGSNSISGGGTASHLATIAMEFPDYNDRTVPSSQIVSQVRERLLNLIVGAEVRVENEESGPPTGSPVNLEISGPDIRVLGELTEQIRTMIEDIPGLVDLKDNFVRGKPEIQVDVDKEKIALLNLDTYTVAYTIKAAINGARVGVYREGKEEYDIVVRLPEEDRQSVESLRRLTVSGPDGQPIPLTSLATINLSSGLGAINRKDQKRVVTISANVSGRLAGEIIMDIQERLEGFSLPQGYSYAFTGEQEEQAKAQAFLGKAFITSIFIIFLVLVTQFNSFSAPFIILTSVILSLIGVFLGLLLTGMPFGVIMTGVGVISLAGVVVNNAIVLIDYFQQLMARGLSTRDALIRAGQVRFRPVVLTAITTILGLLPMATGVSVDFINMRLDIGSESSQYWGSMAVAVIFGLSVATLLTLVVVPVLCSITESFKDRGRRRKERKRASARSSSTLQDFPTLEQAPQS